MPNILVTGADGFVGRHLVTFLEQRGHHVICTSQYSRTDRRILVLNGAGTDWTTALKGVDVLVHLAGIAHRQGIDAAAHHHITVDSCQALLDAVPACPQLKKIIFLSTAKIWGETSGSDGMVITDQSIPAPAAHDGYAKAKHAAEQILMTQDSVPVLAFRPPLIYGAGVKANFARLLEICARGLPGGLPLPLASVRNQRSFLDVLALCDAIAHSINQPLRHHASYGLADNENWSTPALLCFLTTAMNGHLRLAPCPPGVLSTAARLLGKQRLAEQLLGNFHLDCRQFRDDFGWHPPRDSVTALKKLAHLFRENISKRV